MKYICSKIYCHCLEHQRGSQSARYR